VGAEQAPDLLGHDREHALLGELARDRRRDPAQRRLLVRERVQLVLGALARGDVAQEPGEQRRAGHERARDRDLDHKLAAVGAHRRQLDRVADHPALPGRDVTVDAAPVRLAQPRRDDQLCQLAADHLGGRVAERPLGRRVYLDDVAVAVHRDHAVERGGEDGALARLALAQPLLGAPALDAVADPAAEARHRREQVVVAVARLAGEELDRTEDAAAAADREPERGAQALADGHRRAREVGVRADVGDPGRLAAGADAAGQALAGGERDVARDALERLGRLPGLDAAQRLVLRQPHRPRVPAQRAADGGEQARVRRRLVVALREHARDRVLGPQQVRGVVMARVYGQSPQWVVS
jgi:hypothetical protein